jgi:hypothetical protein
MELELKGRSCISNTMTQPITINFQTSSLGRRRPPSSAAAKIPPLPLDYYLNTSRDAGMGTGQNVEFPAGTNAVADRHVFFIVRKKRTCTVGSLIWEHPTRGSTNALDSGDIGRGSLGAPSDQRGPDRCSQRSDVHF